MVIRVYEVAGQPFQIPDEYEPVRPVGHGAYGVVCCCQHTVTEELVAIKRIKLNQDVVEAKRALRELKLLRMLNHENILTITSVLPLGDRATFDSIYIVTPFFPADVSVIIKSSQSLTEMHCQSFLYQILKGLKYMHSACVLHRDLKPNNLLVNRECQLKICDLGLSRLKPDDSVGMMTTYVVTRWYRAPELIMCSKQYDARIDMWSSGCIFAELLARRPLFPGKDYVHQLELMIALLGTPSEEDLAVVSANEKAARYARSLFGVPQISLDTIFSQANPLAVDLLKKMLVFNPLKRITAAEALCHPYLADYHDPEEEKVAENPQDFEELKMLDNDSLTLEHIRDMIYGEVQDLAARRSREAAEAAAAAAAAQTGATASGSGSADSGAK